MDKWVYEVVVEVTTDEEWNADSLVDEIINAGASAIPTNVEVWVKDYSETGRPD